MNNNNFDSRLKNYQFILNRADWNYHYADGQAYHNGRKSVDAVKAELNRMISDFPNEKELIMKLWKDSYGEEKNICRN